ncbi:MAG: DUF5991 domain-containing protein [Bacteroidota bacterium]
MRLLPALLALLVLGCAEADRDPRGATDTDASGETQTPADTPATDSDGDTADDVSADDRPDTDAATETPGASGGIDWEGRYTWTEGAGNYSYGYVLELAYAGPDNPDQLYGTLDIGGTQVATYFDVLGETTDDGLVVSFLTAREDNTTTPPDPGETLFTLRWEDAGDIGDEVGDRVLRTYWGAITPTGAGDAGIGDESTLAFFPRSE